jgi:hypothetical protein
MYQLIRCGRFVSQTLVTIIIKTMPTLIRKLNRGSVPIHFQTNTQAKLKLYEHNTIIIILKMLIYNHHSHQIKWLDNIPYELLFELYSQENDDGHKKQHLLVSLLCRTRLLWSNGLIAPSPPFGFASSDRQHSLVLTPTMAWEHSGPLNASAKTLSLKHIQKEHAVSSVSCEKMSHPPAWKICERHGQNAGKRRFFGNDGPRHLLSQLLL